MTTGISNLELLQRYRADRRELLSFLLSSSAFKKVVMPPGAVAFEDIDLDHVSVDYILECAHKGGVLELSEAIKKYHGDFSLPPAVGSGLDEVFFLVTHPSYSGPAPVRAAPSIRAAAFSGAHSPGGEAAGAKKFSLRSVASAPSRQLSEEVDDNNPFDDVEEEEDEFSTEITRRQLANTSEVVVGLPPFATGLSDDDLRETAYEVLLVAVGAAGGLIVPPKEKQVKKSKLVRRFQRSKAEKSKPPPPPATGLAGLMDTMRTQMEISEADDWRTRQGLLGASQSRVGRRMDTLLVPLELLCTVSRANFSDKKAHGRWQKRQLSVLEEGLLNHPAVPLDASDPRAVELRSLIAKLEEAETLPPPQGPAQEAQTLRLMRGLALALSERPGLVDQPGEICHWADGYHLNVRIYEKLLGSVFDVLEEGRLVEEVEEILELLKSTWRVLGITPIVHNTVYAWVLFRQFVMTSEEALLKNAALQVKRIGSDAQCSAQERDYLKSLRCKVDGNEGPEELSYLQSFLGPIEKWAGIRLGDYHSQFADSARTMEFILTLAMVSEGLTADKSQGRTSMTYATDTAAIAKHYIESSLTLAYEKIVDKLDSSSDTQEETTEHPLTTLAESVENLAKKEARTFAPILSAWHPDAIAIAAALLHRLYGQELKPFQDGISQFSDEVASVLPAADELEVYLLDLVATAGEDGKNNPHMKQLELYHVEVQAEMLVKRWVNSQLSRVSEWVDRTIQQENWDPVSTSKRYALSIVEVFRIVDETTDQFFNLRLPMRLPVLKTLTTGFNSAFLIYVNKLLADLGDKCDLVSPPPTLTRYKRDMAVKATSKKKVPDPRLPDDNRTREINTFTTVNLCVRLNTLHYIETQVDTLESNTRERWYKKRPRDDLSHSNGEDVKSRRGSSGAAAKSGDELSVVFDPTRKACSLAIDKICEFTGTKIIFWDAKDTIIEGLYKISVAQARMDKVTAVLDPVLGQLCEMIDEALRDRIVLGLLQAALEGLLRVLLDGGPTRAFARSDSDMLEEDLTLLKEFFIADGDGLPRSVVNSAAAPVQQILNLYTLETSIVIDSFKRASDQMVAGTSSVQRMGPRIATDADTLLRVLCHRLDREASKFLKKHYNLPKV